MSGTIIRTTFGDGNVFVPAPAPGTNLAVNQFVPAPVGAITETAFVEDVHAAHPPLPLGGTLQLGPMVQVSPVIYAPEYVVTEDGTTHMLLANPSVLGSGTFGSVLDYGDIALKISRVPRSLSQQTAKQREQRLQICLNEINRIRELQDCPHIVSCHGTLVTAEDTADVFYIAMDRLDGNLSGLQNLSGLTVCDILIQVLEALVCLEDVGLLFNDLKPDNVLYSRSGVEGYDIQLGDVGCVGDYNSVPCETLLVSPRDTQISPPARDGTAIAFLAIHLWYGAGEYETAYQMFSDPNRGRVKTQPLVQWIMTTQKYLDDPEYGEAMIEFIRQALSNRSTPRDLLETAEYLASV